MADEQFGPIEKEQINENLKDIRNVAIALLVAGSVFAAACGLAINYLTNDKNNKKSPQTEQKNSISNTKNALKIKNFIRQR